MIKVRQKETATNLVYIYNLDTIESLNELSVWFVGVSSISDLTIRRIQLIDVFPKTKGAKNAATKFFENWMHNVGFTLSNWMRL